MTLPYFIANPNPEYYHTDNYVVLDFEIDTSHGDYGHPVHPANQMYLACWSLGPGHPAFEEEGKVYRLWGNEYEMKPLVEQLQSAYVLVAHNAKYELGWLNRCGFDIGSILVFCTKIAEYVLRGNLKHIDTSLDACARRRGLPAKDPIVDKWMKQGINPIDMPRSWLLGRCEQDVWTTEYIFKDQLGHLTRTSRLGLVYTRCLLSPVLADMETKGMMLDEERVREEHRKETENAERLERELRAMANINWNSSDQLGEFLYETLGFSEVKDRRGNPVRTKGGKPKTDVKTLAALKARTKQQKAFLQIYKDWNKSSQRLSKYLDFYVAVCNQQGGVFYASFNQTVTSTHRLSSSGMRIEFEGMYDDKEKQRSGGTQFQNQPREYKRLFRAKRPGYYFTEEDGSGLEFRVAGLVGNDRRIRSDICDKDFDPHRRSGSIIFDVLEDEVTKEQRTAAKEHTFKPLFGGESGTPAEKRYYAAFVERYSELRHTQDQWLGEALVDKRVVLPWGMQFYFPYCKMDKYGYIADRTKIYNAPIQSFATAEIIPIQAVYMWHLIRNDRKQDVMVMVNTVHDSVLTEVREDAVEHYKEYVTESWQEVYRYVEKVYGMKLEGLPLGTEITVGEHWSEGEEYAYNVWPDRIEEMA